MIRFLIWAVGGAFLLLVFYFLVLWGVTGDWSHPWIQLQQYQPWMGLLVAGFGIQTGLYSLVRKGAVMGANTAVSGTTMAACCAHHLAELVPILGVSGLVVFLTEYQTRLLIFGVLANLTGIGVMGWRLIYAPDR